MQPDDGRVVSNFITQALRGEPLTIYGDGSQTRSFCFVDDEVGGFLALLDSDETGPVNIGNPGEFTMLELADLVNELTRQRRRASCSSRFRRTTRSNANPTSRWRPTALGWSPAVDLRTGLERTIPHFAGVLGLDH